MNRFNKIYFICSNERIVYFIENAEYFEDVLSMSLLDLESLG